MQSIGNKLVNGGNLVFSTCNLVKGTNGINVLSALSKLFSNSINLYGSNVFNQGIFDLTNEIKNGKITKTTVNLVLDKSLLYNGKNGKPKGSFLRINSASGKVTNIGNIQLSSNGGVYF